MARRDYEPEQLVRVVVYLPQRAIEDLELLRLYRHGRESRSQVVREAVMWLRAREAAWILSQRRAQAKRERERAELEAMRGQGAIERKRQTDEDRVDEAVDVVSRSAG